MTSVQEPLGHEVAGQSPFDLPVPPPYRQPLGRLAARLRLAIGTYPTNFVTRAQWGAKPPTSRSTNINPESGGVAWHYEGPKMGTWPHDQCAGKVRQIQAFHMGPQRGWVDIAYTAVVCPHGYIFEARGTGIRTAAQGTNTGNQTYYAVCGLLGEGDALTAQMIEAYKRATNWLRSQGRAATRVKPHRFFHSTGCPGALVIAEALQWDSKPIPEPATSVDSHPHTLPLLGRGQANPQWAVRDVQGHLNYAYRLHPEISRLAITGIWDERTDIRFRDWQRRTGLKVDGLCGPTESWPRLHMVTGGIRRDFAGVDW